MDCLTWLSWPPEPVVWLHVTGLNWPGVWNPITEGHLGAEEITITIIIIITIIKQLITRHNVNFSTNEIIKTKEESQAIIIIIVIITMWSFDEIWDPFCTQTPRATRARIPWSHFLLFMV